MQQIPIETAPPRKRRKARRGPNKNSASDASRTLVVPEILDFAAAGPLFEQLRALRGAETSMDCAAVRRIGAQAAQVMVSAARTWAGDRVPFAIVNCSPEMTEQLRLLGLEALLSGGQVQ